jgi:PAS domain S-box-containing protein
MNRRLEPPMPDGRLRVLHVEDDPVDRELVAATLRGDGLIVDIDWTDTRDGMLRALERHTYDVILADDRLPAFDGHAAQVLAAERTPIVPFIFVSGTLGEEIAIERLKAGAVDYVLKQRLGRLPEAVRRATREARVRAEHARAAAEVLRLNAELEQRVVERTAQLADREEALRASEQRLQSILDHSPALIYVKDLDGRYQFVNRCFVATLGRDAADVLGRTDLELFPVRLASMYRENDAAAIRAMTAVHSEEPSLIGPTVRVYASAKFPLLDRAGIPYAVCGISTDITDRKQAEDQLKTARLEAERANRAKSEFLSRMSHDLRTPLNAILGFAQLLAADALTTDQQECVQQIQAGGRHLLDLINEVLDLTRIEAGYLSLSPEPVHVGDIAAHAAALVAPLGRDRGIAIVVEPSPLFQQSVRADRQRLNQVLLNLLSNAVKYNRDGGQVILSVDQHGSRLRLVVTDTGFGIAEEKQTLLFRPFERLGAESTGVEGTGLGLTLVRGLAEAMGGSVGFRSEVDRGSTFWIELAIAATPVATPVTDAEVSTLRAGTEQTGTILYIEDNVSNVRLMQRVLALRPNLTLVHAPTGHRGLSMARERRPDVILLDLHLPDVGGEEVLRLLWNDPALRVIPVAVLSADATPAHMRRVLASGARAYLTKPLDIPRVLDTLDRLLAARQSRDLSVESET